jgi:hypothetical protein
LPFFAGETARFPQMRDANSVPYSFSFSGCERAQHDQTKKR